MAFDSHIQTLFQDAILCLNRFSKMIMFVQTMPPLKCRLTISMYIRTNHRFAFFHLNNNKNTFLSIDSQYVVGGEINICLTYIFMSGSVT